MFSSIDEMGRSFGERETVVETRLCRVYTISSNSSTFPEVFSFINSVEPWIKCFLFYFRLEKFFENLTSLISTEVGQIVFQPIGALVD